MNIICDPAVIKELGSIYIGLGIIKNLEIKNQVENLNSIKDRILSKIKKSYTIENIKDTEIVKAYRNFYWRFMNIDPTKTRPSGEALARRVLKNQDIPIINNIVFSINLVSIETQLSFSAFDLSKIKFPLTIRYAYKEEEFRGIGTRYKILIGNELLLADSEKILCMYAYGDADYTKITSKTKDILLVNYGVPGISGESLEKGIQNGLSYLQKAGGGEIGEIFVSKCAPPEL